MTSTIASPTPIPIPIPAVAPSYTSSSLFSSVHSPSPSSSFILSSATNSKDRGATHRKRTTSLLSSVSSQVSHSMPLFSGRFSIHGGGPSAPSNSSTTSDSAHSSSSKSAILKRSTSSASGSKKSRILGKRISTPISTTSTVFPNPFLSSNRLGRSSSGEENGHSPLEAYTRRAQAYSRSSPDLPSMGRAEGDRIFHSGYLSDDQSENRAIGEGKARKTPTKRRPVPSTLAEDDEEPITVCHSPAQNDEGEGDEDDCSNRYSPPPSPSPQSPQLPTRAVALSPRPAITTFIPPRIPSSSPPPSPPPRAFRRNLSASPPPSPASRAQARAEALAKLTDPAPSLSSPAPPPPSSPTTTKPRIPFPSRPPPPVPREASSGSSDASEEDEGKVRGPSSNLSSLDASSEAGGGSRGVSWADGGGRAGSTEKMVLKEDKWEKEVKRIRVFLERELGSMKGKGRAKDAKEYQYPMSHEEADLWKALRDGEVLLRLLCHFVPALAGVLATTAIPEDKITFFLFSLKEHYAFPSDDLFNPSDLVSGSRVGFKRVLHTLSNLESRTPPTTTYNSRRVTTSLIGISAKSRPVRARNSSGSGGGLTGGHMRDASLETNTTGGSSPASSRYTDYSFASSSTRHSIEISPSLSSGSLSPPSTLSKSVSVSRIYGDRRMAESAIDVLSVVEEDEGSVSGKSPTRRSQPFPSLLGTSAPGSDEHSLLRASPSARRQKRFSSEKPAWLDSDGASSIGMGVPSTIINKNRRRHSSDLSRPKEIRSFSHSHTQMTAAERAERGAIEVGQDLAMRPASRNSESAASSNGTDPTVTSRRSETTILDQPSPPLSPPPPTLIASGVPFPSEDGALPPGDEEEHLKPFPPNPRKHKRWNSELHIEKPFGKEEGSANPTPPRSRHESFAPVAKGGGEAVKSSPVGRTKLVLRGEDGRPSLTYQLGECIGRGQFGAVYRALNLNSGRVVAVKRIQLEGKTEEEIIQLSNEVSLLKALAHPGVVKYEGLVRTEHYINIILEYVENGSLQKTLKHFGELPEGLVASYVVKILEGLEYLHSRQVVHCDLKAANILSTKTGNIKIGDFGVSLNLNAVKNNRTAVGNTLNDPAAIIPEVDVAGTPNWMAPEVIELRGASTASDIWSLACTIVELISGKPPYAELNAMAAMFRIVEDDRPPIPARCSPELHDFLTQCFAKDPKERPSARSLFEHEWLNIHWEVHKELRPQDSIPFLRRISSEMRRPELNIVLNPVPEGSLSKPALFSSQPQQASAQDLAFFSSSPTSTTKNDQTSPLFGEITNYMRPTPAAELFRRASMNASRTSLDFPTSPDAEHPSEEIIDRPHAFVKTTFSKAVDCKLCFEPTKRHAVLCKDCGLISHSRCAEFAPLPCDFRSQLLNYSRSLAPRSPPPLTHSSSSSGFNFAAVILPFSKNRRSSTKVSAQAPSRTESVVGLGITAGVGADPYPPPQGLSSPRSSFTATPPKAVAAGLLHFSDVVNRSRSRSPGGSPASRTGSVGSQGERGSSTAGGSTPGSSEIRAASILIDPPPHLNPPTPARSTTTGGLAALLKLPRKKSSLADEENDGGKLERKRSLGVGLPPLSPTISNTSTGTKLQRKKSHGRSLSQPIKPPKEKDDCVIQ